MVNKVKFFVFAPDEDSVILKIINAAAEAGAGKIGNYSHCAFLTKGEGNWVAMDGAKPHVGKVGKMERKSEVKIEMECFEENAKEVAKAIKEVHPYEEVAIDFVRIFSV